MTEKRSIHPALIALPGDPEPEEDLARENHALNIENIRVIEANAALELALVSQVEELEHADAVLDAVREQRDAAIASEFGMKMKLQNVSEEFANFQRLIEMLCNDGIFDRHQCKIDFDEDLRCSEEDCDEFRIYGLSICDRCLSASEVDYS